MGEMYMAQGPLVFWCNTISAGDTKRDWNLNEYVDTTGNGEY